MSSFSDPTQQEFTWHLKIGHPKRKLVFQPSIFRCHVSFREGGSFPGLVHLSNLSFRGGNPEVALRRSNRSREHRSNRGHTGVGVTAVFVSKEFLSHSNWSFTQSICNYTCLTFFRGMQSQHRPVSRLMVWNGNRFGIWKWLKSDDTRYMSMYSDRIACALRKTHLDWLIISVLCCWSVDSLGYFELVIFRVWVV